ncbi:MAG: zf-HC2 domain-containing protein, partial [Calditrichia bacterium]
MDCNFIEKNEIHDKYLLHKLSDEEKQEYEQHIQDCERCRKELEHQLLIIGGIRQMGREEMKLEIRRQAEVYRQQRAGANWTVILKTAAVILFLVLAPGMIYYYQYFAPLEKQKQT